MSKWYRITHSRWNLGVIHEVEVERTTEKCVWFRIGGKENFRRANIESEWYKFIEDKDEAVAYALQLLTREIEYLTERTAKANKQIKELRK